jgi:acetyl-CoA acetyltransferase
MTDAYVLGGVRTPVGRYGGALSHLRTDDLLGQAMRGAGERVGVPLERVEGIAAGCVNTAHKAMGDTARWGAQADGVADSVPAYTVNRFCASSLTAAINVAAAVQDGQIGIAGAVRAGAWPFISAHPERDINSTPAAWCSCWTRCGPAAEGRRTQTRWRATRTWR